MKRFSRIGLPVPLLLLSLTVNAAGQVEEPVIALRGDIRVEPATGSLLSRPAGLAVEGVSVSEALTLLSTAANVSVAFSPNSLPPGSHVDCGCTDVTIAEALDRILLGTEFGYLELDDQVVIVKRPKTQTIRPFQNLPLSYASASLPASYGIGGSAEARTSGNPESFRPRQEAVVAGVVVDGRSGSPIMGAQVVVVGTRTGTLTNETGRFRITGITGPRLELEVVMMGYRTARQEVSPGQTDVRIELTVAAVDLDAIIVTATGEARAREVGNSLSRITSKEIGDASVRTVQDILTARTPGIVVLQNSGQPGTGGSIRLRGINSISQGNEPIIYLDGIRISGGGAAPTHSASNQSVSPLNDIDPSIIERVEIVKGAAATTLYGTEASSGVIQIFTKRGRTGEARWTAEMTTGLNNIGHVGPEEDKSGLWMNKCRGPLLVGYDGRAFEDPTCPSSGSWLQNGLVQRYSLSVDGGADWLTYYLSGSFSDEEGVIYSADGTQSTGASANFGINPHERLEISLHTSLTKRTTQWIPSGVGTDAFLVNVTRGFASNYAGAEGCSSSDVVCVANAEVLKRDNTTEGDHFITGLSITHHTSPNITNRLTFGYDFNSSRLQAVVPFGQQRTPLGEITVTDWTRSLLSAEYVGSYRRQVSSSLASTSSWGGQMFADENQTRTVEAFDFSGPGEPTLTSAARRDVALDERLRVINAGVFLQELLAWRDRLFLTGGVRVDGNSAFGKSFGLQVYPKLNASYVLSDQTFWPDEWWEVMKIRAAWGESGRAPGAFDAVQTWDPVAADDGKPAFTPAVLGNADLGPERSREIEVGFETSLFQGRFSLDFTHYWQTTTDALLPVQFSPSLGFSARQLKNVGVLRNRGYEARFTMDVVRRPDLNWSLRADFTESKSEAVDLGGEDITVHSSSRVYVREGFPVPGYFGAKVTNPNEKAAPIIEDDAFLGTPYPTQTIALGSNLDVGTRLTIDILGEFQLGGHLLNNPGYQNGRKGAWPACYEIQQKYLASQSSDPAAMDDVRAMDRARCALDKTSPKPDRTYWVEPSDFFRLRNISLTYRIPSNFVPLTQSAMLRLGANNLFTSTSYSGTDPEVDDEVRSLGRRDYYVIPTYRTFTASLRITF